MEPALVDRVDELARLRELLDAADAGQPAFAFVAGDAGVGKSRLLTELAAGTPCRVLRGQCLPLGERGLPFAPIVEILRALRGDDELSRLVPPALDALVPGHNEVAGRAPLFQAILDLIEALAEEQTVLLLLEDLHWAGRSTRDLLSFVVANMRSQQLLVVGSVRTDDLHRGHPLLAVLAELTRNPRVHQIDLRPFGPEHVVEYLEAITGSLPSRPLIDSVMARTDGNPYFIEQLVAADGLTRKDLPAGLRELLLVRVDSVSAQTQHLLRVASIAGGEFGEQLLAEVAELTPEAVRAAMREAVAAQLVSAVGDGYRFRHALMSEALAQDLLPGERADTHAAYARVLTAAPELGSGGPAEVAAHLSAAGETSRALAAWAAAADAAEEVFAFAEARRHLEDAASVATDRSDLLRRAAENAYLAGDPDGACRMARQALELIDEQARPAEAGIVHDRLARYLRDTTDHAGALAEQRLAVELVPADPPSAERAQVLAGLGGHLMFTGRHREAREVSQAALELARHVGAALPEMYALNTLGTVTCSLDDVDAGLEQIEAALALAQIHGDSQEQVRAHWNLFASAFDAARWDETLARFAEASEQFPRLGQTHLLPAMQVTAADALVRLGRWDEAQAVIDEARRIRPEDQPGLAELLIARGDFDEASAFLARRLAVDLSLDDEQRAWPWVNLADLATWQGNLDQARDAIDRALELSHDLDEALATGYALAIGLRAEAERADEARARSRPDVVEDAMKTGATRLRGLEELMRRPGPADGWKREVGALATQSSAESARLRAEPDPDGWASAVEAWEALSMPYHAAYCRFRQAEASLGAGRDREAALALLIAAHATAAGIGAAPLQALVERLARRARLAVGGQRPDAAPYGLTPREQAVLDLVAKGATNKQIGSALYISDKTASVHVSNLLRKLDVSSRGEAASLAYQEGLLSQE